jgi:hypothetical protein
MTCEVIGAGKLLEPGQPCQHPGMEFYAPCLTCFARCVSVLCFPRTCSAEPGKAPALLRRTIEQLAQDNLASSWRHPHIAANLKKKGMQEGILLHLPNVICPLLFCLMLFLTNAVLSPAKRLRCCAAPSSSLLRTTSPAAGATHN